MSEIITSELLLVTLLTAIVAALLVWLFMHHRIKAEQEKSQTEVQRRIALDAELKNINEALLHAREELKQEKNTLDQLQSESSVLKSENARLQTLLSEQKRNNEEKINELKDVHASFTAGFKNLANDIFEAKGKNFAEQSKNNLDALLNPFKEQLEGFRKRVDEVHTESVKGQSALKSEITKVLEVGLKMSDETHDLTTALKGQKKMQGNWGELVLENVLDRSGLVKGQDYRREVSFTTEEGKSRPDVIVDLPEGKHLVIDAKVSLNAYTRFVNEEDDIAKQQALKEHVAAISDRIKELSGKNYFDLPGINSPDMVFMFIPIESAFVEALKADENLFQDAIEKNILVATPTTLLTSLNIVRQLWRFEDQNKHTAALADKAAKFYQKLNTFLVSMEGVGNQLDKAKDTYSKAFSQLYTGRGNLIKQASEFKELGVSVQSELSEKLVDKATLELDHIPDQGD